MTQDTAARDAYDAWHTTLGPDEARAEDPWHWLIRERLTRADLEVNRALEIGCGRGGFACWLASQPSRPAEIVAADFSAAAVELGQRTAGDRFPGVRWVQADIQEIPFPDASFTTVFSCETIEHVPDPVLAVRQLARVLAPGGRLFLTTPNYLGTPGLYRGYLWLRGRTYTEVGQPINQFTTLGKTKRWVRQAGLTIQAVATSGHYFHMPRRPPLRVRFLDRLGPLTRWCGHHSLVVATRP